MTNNTYDHTTLLGDYLEAAGAKQPAPGGGAVAAIAGALAAAMGEMALRYSVGRKATVEHDAAHEQLVKELARGRAVLTALAAEDQAAYAALVAAKKGDDVEATKQAAATAIAVPQSIAATAAEVLASAERAAATCNPWLLSDLAVCCELSMATVRSGLHNVRANLGDADPADLDRIGAECSQLLINAANSVTRTIKTIHDRQRAG
jgi:formiminotetrahydrofolate cyclodeaminase